MNDSRASDSFRHKVRGVLTTSMLAGFVFIGLLAPAAGEPEGSNPVSASAFDYHCEKRYCQFWLTDSSLMLRSDLRFEWEFGDGQSSNKPAPLHIYERDGRFQPILTVYDHADAQLLASSNELLLGFEQNSLVSEIGGAFTGAVGMLSGTSVAGLRDFNGDGLGDLLVGAPDFFGQNVGRAHIAFGRNFVNGATIDLTTLNGTDGFTFLAGDTGLSSVGFSGARLGAIVSGVNRAAAIGAPGNSTSGQSFFNRGYVAVLYSSTGGFPAQVTALDLNGNNGFLIEGPIEEAFGFSVAAAGDFNGDGLEDILIGAPQAPLDSTPLNRGETYVIYGRDGGFPSILSTFGLAEDEAFVFEGIVNGDRSGWSVDGIGDFNGDGFDDIVIGAPTADDFIFIVQDSPRNDLPEAEGVDVEGTIGIQPGPGAAYVIFGGQADLLAQGRAALDANLLDGERGFALRTTRDDMIGWTVAGVGDLNNNGSGDLAVSAPWAPNAAEFVSGAVYVLFGGQAGPFQPNFDPVTSLVGTNGFALTGLFQGLGTEFQGDRTISLSSAGDVNGDGFDDLVVGLPGVADDVGLNAGVAFVIFGRDGAFPPEIDLTNLDPADGFMIVPDVSGSSLGQSVAGLGDFDGDGQDDLALGAPGNSVTRGIAWVVPGQITASEPLINGGAGIVDQTAAFTSLFEIDFEISDVLDPPQDLIVQVFSGDPDFLPDEALTLSGDGAIRTLSIDTSQAGPGSVAILVLVTNSSDLTGAAEFVLEIVPQPPLINDGAGIPERNVFSGQSLEIVFTVSDVQDDPADILVTATSDTPELIPQDGITITEIGNERILEFQAQPDSAGTGQITIEATNSFGLSTSEELTVQVLDTPFPLINGGDGIPDQVVDFTDELVINFAVSDLLDQPEDLVVQVFSGTPELLPNEALSLAGAGATRSLVIDSSLGFPGSLPIQVLVTNTADLTSEAEFILSIIEQPPVINDGDGVPEQRLFAGQLLELDFTVTDLQDDPGDILVTATSVTPELIPPENISLGGSGQNRTLQVQTILGEGGVGQVSIQATNSFDLTTSEQVIIVIDDTPNPVINDGAGIDDQELTAGESLTIDFEVADPEFPSDAIELSAVSGNEDVLPTGQLAIQGEGATRTLVIESSAGNIGSTPITIEARNPVDGTDEVTFGLTITAAPPSINNGEPIDDAEVPGGDTLSVDFQVIDPLDSADILSITVESSNTELVPLDAITIEGSGNERTLIIETRPGTQGESLITLTVTNTNGQVDVREFLVEVFLLPTTLDLSLDAFSLPVFPDLLVRLSAANTGEDAAYSVLLAAEIPEPFEAIGVFVESQNCVVAEGAVSCEVDSLPAWECSLFDGTLVCELEALQPEHEAGVILRVQGSGQAELTALLDALNASDVAAEIELEF